MLPGRQLRRGACALALWLVRAFPAAAADTRPLHEESFTLAAAGEVVAALRASCAGCDWAGAGARRRRSSFASTAVTRSTCC
jgi:hypothetical protein